MISSNKKRISIAIDAKTLEFLEYNSSAMGITKSELISRYVKMIGKAGEKNEITFIKYFSRGREK